jgi:cellulose synthase operon protein C
MQLAPNSPMPYVALGQLRMQQKRNPDAEKLFSKALDLDPASVEALKDLATIDMMAKQPQKALDRVNAQIAKQPKLPSLYVLLAMLQSNSKDMPGAEASLEKAMQLDPANAAAINLYTSIEATQGKPEKAITTLEQWTKAHPTDGAAFATLGTLAEQMHDRDKAQAYYQKALQVQPDQPVAANNLAFLMMETGQNIDQALTLAQTARRAMPDSPNSADTLAWAYYHKGEYPSARDLLEDAAKQAPKDAIIQYHLGMVFEKLADKTNAAAHLKKALTLSPQPNTADDIKKALVTIG